MEWYWALIFLLGTVMALMFLGVPVAIAFFGANIVGVLTFLGGEAGLVQLERNIVDGLVRFSLAPVAMFILMGEILFHTGIAIRAIDAIDKLIARVPGRLSLVAVAGGTVFSTLSGSSMANTALLGTTLMPEMQRRGYHRSMATILTESEPLGASKDTVSPTVAPSSASPSGDLGDTTPTSSRCSSMEPTSIRSGSSSPS